jgi:hypothetical protein
MINQKAGKLDCEKAKLTLTSQVQKIQVQADKVLENSFKAVYNPNYKGGDPDLIKEIEGKLDMKLTNDAKRIILNPDTKGLVESIVKKHAKNVSTTKVQQKYAGLAYRMIAGYLCSGSDLKFDKFKKYLDQSGLIWNKFNFKNMVEEQEVMNYIKLVFNELEKTPRVQNECKIALKQCLAQNKEEQLQKLLEKEKVQVEEYNKKQEQKRLERKGRKEKKKDKPLQINEISKAKGIKVKEVKIEPEVQQLKEDLLVGKVSGNSSHNINRVIQEASTSSTKSSNKSSKHSTKHSKKSSKVEFIKLPNPNMVDVINGKAINKYGEVIPMYILKKVTTD